MREGNWIACTLFRKGLPLLTIFMYGCTEPFDAQTQTFVSALVIEATITDEMKQQTVTLRRTYPLEEEGLAAEQNATVRIFDDTGSGFDFTEREPGIYTSDVSFAAAEGREYVLEVTTSVGGQYSSDPVPLTPAAEISDLYAERMTIGGTEGMAIRVNAAGLSGDARHYRYEYEETFKIIAPDWFSQDLVGDPEGGCGLIFEERPIGQQTCYSTEKSTEIILTNTTIFSDDEFSGFVVRFINRNNYIISHRYSMLLRQYVQSPAAYSYFETLKEFSGTGSLFSQNQPGFLASNVYSAADRREPVLGYFDVATVVERRIFFDYADFFPGEPLPPYVNNCNRIAPVLANPAGCVLRDMVEGNIVKYLENNDQPEVGQGPYLVVPRVCGDCTEIGVSEVPAFWTE